MAIQLYLVVDIIWQCDPSLSKQISETKTGNSSSIPLLSETSLPPYESPWLVSLFHLMSGLFVSQTSFLFQVWPDLEWNQDSADRPGELLHRLTRSCFLLLLLWRLFLLALPLLLKICLLSLWSPPFPLHDPTLILLSLARLIWYSGQTALFLFLLARAAPACLPTALSAALRPLFPF